MEYCDICNKKVHEKNLITRETENITVMICTSCNGAYSDEEIDIYEDCYEN